MYWYVFEILFIHKSLKLQYDVFLRWENKNVEKYFLGALENEGDKSVVLLVVLPYCFYGTLLKSIELLFIVFLYEFFNPFNLRPTPKFIFVFYNGWFTLILVSFI